MDGISSAYIARNNLERNNAVVPIPLQYSREDELFKLNLTKQDVCYFVDFSFKIDKMI